MFVFFILPFSVVAWFFGMLHSRHPKGWAKWGFLILLAVPVFIETQALIIFIAAAFVLGFIFDQEGSIKNLLQRLKSVLSNKASGQIKYHQDDQNKTSDEKMTNQDYREEIRRKREEELRNTRGQ